MMRCGILYGALAWLTLVGVRNENTHLAADGSIFGLDADSISSEPFHAQRIDKEGADG